MKTIIKYTVLLLSLFTLCSPAFALQVTPVTPLFQAILNANISQVKAAVNNGANVNQRGMVEDDGDYWERTPLILAAHMGQADTVTYLLQHGAKVNEHGRVTTMVGFKLVEHDTALSMAARRAHEDVIRALVTYGKGIHINEADKLDRLTALMYMTRYERIDSIKFLLDNGASFYDAGNVLDETIYNKSRATLDYLISRGVDINNLSGGQTVLTTAISRSEDDIPFKFAQYFLTKKPKINLQISKNGMAAIHSAAGQKSTRSAKLLLEHGANVNLQDTIAKMTPLFHAMKNNKMVKFLLKNGANTEIENIQGNTILISATNEVYDDVIKTLMENGANPNKKSSGNGLFSSLTTLAGHPNPHKHSDALDAMESILDNGGNVDFKNGLGLTPLMCAAQKSDNSDGYANAKFLIKHGAKLDLVNNKGETAMMLAAGAGNDKLVKYLIKEGADPKIKNGAGETVANYAKRGGSSTSYLESKGVKAVTPTIKKSVIVKDLIGTWTGSQDGLPQAVCTVILKSNGTYSFSSKLSNTVWKQIPASARKSMKRTIASHKGKYTVNGNILVWIPTNADPTSMHWKLSGGTLIIDNTIRLKK